MDAYILTNLLTNGNFATGSTSGWSANNGPTVSVVSVSTDSVLAGAGALLPAATYAAKIVNGSSQYGQLVQNVSGTSGHKYYFRASMVKPENTKSGGIQLQLAASPYTSYGSNTSTTSWTSWETISCIALVESTATLGACLDVNRTDSTSGATGYFTNVLLVDLTASFGSGSEPDLDWCDSNISYFSGSVDQDGNEVVIITPAGEHNTNIGNVAYDVEGATVKIGGVAYEIESGTVLSGGVERDVVFKRACIITMTGNLYSSTYGYITINNKQYYSAATVEVEEGTVITFHARRSGTAPGRVKVNGVQVFTNSTDTMKAYSYTVNSNISISMSRSGGIEFVVTTQ